MAGINEYRSIVSKDLNFFKHLLSQFVINRKDTRSTTTLYLDGRKESRWQLFDYRYIGFYDVILRRPSNNPNVPKTVSEYVRVKFPKDGGDLNFVPVVAFQNDNDYKNMGWERFDGLTYR